ncbi:polysaccharide deacetylase family protein [Bacillus carboniphilus]|uniref:Polysaccharide deacetylase family protein n=1 Tax=Bacillus carboniphilus TaxID=86663 RepID=A0ABY9JYA5_9BACI|nr:polysaccharide deacetylase family protein [Bacillus carboniphilus]WLR43498.1 polysaccharide deacetylase family protein [Bacillus carboniphilus]
MRKNLLHFVGCVALIFLCFGSSSNPIYLNYQDHANDLKTVAGEKQDKLYKQIMDRASLYEIKPIDAINDEVWKLTPGYNGLKINVSESYQVMKRNGNQFNKELLAFEQIPPAIHMEDLDPAPIYRGNPEKPMVSFIINVAWGNEYLPEMLSILNQNHVKATFFLEGRWAKNNPQLVKMIKEEGHEIGNHSYTHPKMENLSFQSNLKELKNTNDVIQSLTGDQVKWFAPPSGSFNKETIQAADELGLFTIMWSVDTVDWQRPAPHVLIERVMNKVHNGAIILMHPTSSTVQSLETLIMSIKNKRLAIGSLSVLFEEERILK